MSREPFLPPPASHGTTPRGAFTPLSPEHEPSFREYWSSAGPYLGRAALGILAGVLVTVVIAFLWPPTYVARATLLPPTEEDTGFSAASVLRGLNMPGIKIPSRMGPEDVTVSILRSRRLAGTLVHRFGLLQVYHVASEEAAINKLQKKSSFKVDESGDVLITVADRSPVRAAQLANAFTEELDRFNRETRMTKGRRMRLFVEGRLEETQKSLAVSEKALEEYGRLHKTIVLSADQMSTVESGADLFARQIALQTKLGTLRDYASESSEEVRQTRQELDQINSQIARLPELGMDQAKMLREVKIQEQVYALLSGQYEEARINEVRDVTTVEVLDVAVPPEHRAWPRRGLLVAIGLAVSTFCALAWIAWSVRRVAAPA